MNRLKILSTIMLVLLVLPLGIPLVKTQAASTPTIETSADPHGGYFYNNIWVEIKVVDTNVRGSDNVTVNVYKNDNPVGSITLKEIGSSGVFVGYVIYNTTNVSTPANALVNNFIYLNSALSLTLSDGDTLKFEYIGPTGTVTATLTYKPFKAQISLDRTEVPAYNETVIYVTVYDQDYNTDPTSKQTMTYNITLEAVDKLGAVYKGPVNLTLTLTETEPNSAKFEGSFTVGDVLETLSFSNYNITRTDYNGVTLNFINTTALANNTVPFDHITVKTLDDTSTTFTFTSAAGLIEEPTSSTVISLATELDIKVKDPDRNLDTKAKDVIPVNVSTSFGYVIANLTETGENTGEFEGTVKLTYNPTPVAPNGGGDELKLNQTYTLTIEYLDTSTGATSSKVTVDMTSYAPELTADKTTALPSETVTLTLKDMDLNDKGNDTLDSFGATVTAGNPLNIAFPAGNLTVKVNGEVMNASRNDFLFFEEVEPGVFKVTFDLSLINTTLSEGDKVTFVWHDNYDDKDATAEVEIVKPEINVTLDRSVYPIPNNGQFKVYVTVYDPYANQNPGIPETLSSACSAEIILWNGTSLSITWSGDLTETDIDTGVFEGSFTVSLGTWTSNYELFTGSTLKVTFTDPVSSNTYEATAVIKPSTATLSVNVTTVSVGDYITITLVEPDANTDSRTTQTVTVTIDGDVTGTVTLEETGANTGVFTKTLRIGADAPFNTGASMAHKTFKVKYTDTYSAQTSVTQKRSVDLTETVTVVSHTAKIWVGTAETENNTLGPFSTMVIYYMDPDQILVWENGNNVTFTGDDRIYIRSTLGDELWIGSLAPVSDHPALFKTEVQLQFNDTAYSDNILQVTVPDKIVIRAVDKCDETGASKALVYWVNVRAWDGELTVIPSKPYYNNGDDITIRLVDPDANRNPNQIETVQVKITSWKLVNGELQPVDPAGATLTLVETGENTGVFEAPYTIDTSKFPPFFSVGDTLKISYEDQIASDGKTKVTSEVLLPIGYMTTTPVKPAAPENVTFTDVTGAPITPKAGTPLLLRVPVSNLDTTRSVTVDVILVAYTPDGVPVSVSYSRITLNPGESTTASVGWIPPAAGDYKVKVFFWNLAEKTPLSEEPLQLTITVE